jgi:hypothetical protein
MSSLEKGDQRLLSQVANRVRINHRLDQWRIHTNLLVKEFRRYSPDLAEALKCKSDEAEQQITEFFIAPWRCS